MTRLNAATLDDQDDQINLTPLLDVVFIILIFFIVTASFIRESGLEVNRSDDTLALQPTAEAILVSIDANDDIWIEGQVVDRRAVRAHIVRLHSVNPDWPVVIEPQNASTTELLVAVLDAAKASGIENISIAGEVGE